MLYDMPSSTYNRGPCETEGCDKQRWKQGYCQKCARARGLCDLPRCAAEGCGRQAQSAGEGSLCRPCRRASSCGTEGCRNAPRGGGYCIACSRRLDRASSPTCRTEGCDNAPQRGPGDAWCDKHYYHPDACVRPHCSDPAIQAGVCARHCTESQSTCRVDGCASPRYLSRLCYRHYREANLHKCGHPTCGVLVDGIYCKTHDMGIDFAAGDWHDWVAAERLWAGKQGDRPPTVPELREVIRKAEVRDISYNELARRIGVDENRMQSWRQMLGRLEGVA